MFGPLQRYVIAIQSFEFCSVRRSDHIVLLFLLLCNALTAGHVENNGLACLKRIFLGALQAGFVEISMMFVNEFD